MMQTTDVKIVLKIGFFIGNLKFPFLDNYLKQGYNQIKIGSVFYIEKAGLNGKKRK